MYTTKTGQNHGKIKSRTLRPKYPLWNTSVSFAKVQICPLKNEGKSLFLSFTTHFPTIVPQMWLLQTVLTSNGLGLRKLGVKFCFALCWTFSKTRTGNRTKDLPPLLSNPWFGECLNDRHLKMLNFKWVSDQSTTLQHGKIEPKNWKSALLINHNGCLNIIGNNIPLQPKSITK